MALRHIIIMYLEDPHRAFSPPAAFKNLIQSFMPPPETTPTLVATVICALFPMPKSYV